MYIYVQDNKINGKGYVKQYGANIENIEVDEEIFNNYEKYHYKNNEIVFNENYKIEQEQIKAEEKGKLSLTRGDVFRGLMLSKGIKRSQIRNLIENSENLNENQKELALIDFDEALHFYRGNSLINTLGKSLGINSEQLDKFFETNNYNVLLERNNDNLV